MDFKSQGLGAAEAIVIAWWLCTPAAVDITEVNLSRNRFDPGLMNDVFKQSPHVTLIMDGCRA